MPKYAKFMKDLLTNKAKFEETSKVTLNERCSIVLLNKIPLKEKDPRSFTIPCAIGRVGIDKALADLGASISLMPYLMFVRLELGELKPTRMCIELANKSTQYRMGIVENVIVKIEKFVFLVDLVVLDMEEDFRETLPMDQLDSFLFEPIKYCQPSKDINLWEDDTEVAIDKEKLQNSLDSPTTPGLFSDLDDFKPDHFKNPILYAASTTDMEKHIPKPKELPSHLEYAFLDRAVLGQRIDKKFQPIYYANKTVNDTQDHYTTTEKELLDVVYAFDKFQSYLVMSKTVVYTDHSALKYLFSKQDENSRLIRLENPEPEELDEEAIRDSFLDEHLMAIYVKEHEKDPQYADYGLPPPTTRGQIENINRAIKRILERTVNGNRNEWAYKLDDALWAFRTAYKSPIRSTPFRTEEIGEEVLVFNSRLKLFLGKLKTRWYGPYKVSKVIPYGTVEVCGKDGVRFKVATAEKSINEITSASS
ncbi:reverse transcriptase domain-containing protein [Tanacetum coccineum]